MRKGRHGDVFADAAQALVAVQAPVKVAVLQGAPGARRLASSPRLASCRG
jgi:hypothetical protein